MGSTWRLYLCDDLVGEIEITDSDFPWLSGTFVAHPGFAAVKPLFDEELAAIEAEDWEAHDALYVRIRGTGLRLFAPDGHEAAEFLLHIRNDEAWFRYENEPFTTSDPIPEEVERAAAEEAMRQDAERDRQLDEHIDQFLDEYGTLPPPWLGGEADKRYLMMIARWSRGFSRAEWLDYFEAHGPIPARWIRWAASRIDPDARDDLASAISTLAEAGLIDREA